jgi:hypothetical protein
MKIATVQEAVPPNTGCPEKSLKMARILDYNQQRIHFIQ